MFLGRRVTHGWTRRNTHHRLPVTNFTGYYCTHADGYFPTKPYVIAYAAPRPKHGTVTHTHMSRQACPRTHMNEIAQPAVVIDQSRGIQDTVLTYDGRRIHYCPRHENGARADRAIPTHNRARMNCNYRCKVRPGPLGERFSNRIVSQSYDAPLYLELLHLLVEIVIARDNLVTAHIAGRFSIATHQSYNSVLCFSLNDIRNYLRMPARAE